MPLLMWIPILVFLGAVVVMAILYISNQEEEGSLEGLRNSLANPENRLTMINLMRRPGQREIKARHLRLLGDLKRPDIFRKMFKMSDKFDVKAERAWEMMRTEV